MDFVSSSGSYPMLASLRPGGLRMYLTAREGRVNASGQLQMGQIKDQVIVVGNTKYYTIQCHV